MNKFESEIERAQRIIEETLSNPKTRAAYHQDGVELINWFSKMGFGQDYACLLMLGVMLACGDKTVGDLAKTFTEQSDRTH